MLLRRVMKHVRDQNWFAVGLDFLIVVCGVFIGIQVANWNAERVERLQESDYVRRLADDLRHDIQSYDEMLLVYSIKQETILALRDAPLTTVMGGDLKDAALRLEYSVYKAMPAQRSATFDELVGSGTLRLVRNNAFRATLADYYARNARLTEILAQPLGDYTRMLVGAIPGEIPIENLQDSDEKTADRIMAGLEALRANPSFESAANAEIYYGRDVYNWLHHFRAQASELLLMLEEPKGKEP
jgi:hypothetical protein